MSTLEHSVQASNDNSFKLMHKIARYNYRKFLYEPDLIDKFLPMCSENLTFVDTWNDEKITPPTMTLYRKKYQQDKPPRNLLIQ